MNYIVRVVRFIKKYSVAHPRFFGTYAWHYFSPRFLPRVSFLKPKALLELLQAGKSFIRFGDGEIYLLNGGTMGYEASTPRIRSMYQRIIRSYTNDAPYVLGINEGPLTTTNADLKDLGLLHCWLPLKSYYQAFFPKGIAYLDSSIFYFNEMVPLYVEPYLQGKTVVIVTRQKNIEAIKNNPRIPFADIKYVETPDTHTSRVYDAIYESVKAVLVANNKPAVVLVACGPMSKIMVYDLAEAGYQAIDIGIGIELMYTDTDKSYMVMPPSPYRLPSMLTK
jgi:Glycosyltransferase GT-D fold